MPTSRPAIRESTLRECQPQQGWTGQETYIACPVRSDQVVEVLRHKLVNVVVVAVV